MRLRLQSELQRMGSGKSLEATVANLRGELERERKELEAKKALMSEFEGVLEGMRTEMSALRRRLNLYELLTATKLSQSESGDVQGKEERFECRTVERARGG